MPFHIREMFDGICSKLSNNSILRNPVYTSLLILVCILLVSTWVYRDIDPGEDDSQLSLSLRLSGYLIVLILPIVFLHNKNVSKDYEARGASELAAEIFRKPIGGENDGAEVVIQPDVGDVLKNHFAV